MEDKSLRGCRHAAGFLKLGFEFWDGDLYKHIVLMVGNHFYIFLKQRVLLKTNLPLKSCNFCTSTYIWVDLHGQLGSCELFDFDGARSC